jgi:hypothetical protein
VRERDLSGDRSRSLVDPHDAASRRDPDALPASAMPNGWSMVDAEIPRTRRLTLFVAGSISVTEL